LEWHVCWNHWDAWQEYIFSLKFSIQNGGLDDIVREVSNRKPGTVAKSWRIDVSEKKNVGKSPGGREGNARDLY
jgi:hypothetical protein